VAEVSVAALDEALVALSVVALVVALVALA